MAPKKSKKISLNEFLGDSTLGSWADEMDSLPNAPAPKIDEESSGRFRRDDYSNARSDRQSLAREDVPLPTQPPYTAFVGNLAFDLTEAELSNVFASSKIKSVKIIKDKDEKPKGFGYVEFDDLEGLKQAMTKTNSNVCGRVIRVSVAEPWKRDGPLSDSSRRRFDGPAERQPSSVADETDDWRSSRPQRLSEPEVSGFKRKGSGLLSPDSHASPAEKEDVWVMGSKFKPSNATSNDEASNKFGFVRGRNEVAPPRDLPSDERDWRSAARSRPTPSSISPNNSTPPTPHITRKKLELLPKSGNASVTPSPLSSPKIGSTPSSSSIRPSPFGSAKPVDVSSREKEVADRLDREKEGQQGKLTLSRTSSRAGTERNSAGRSATPPSAGLSQTASKSPNLAPTVRPTLSFANAAKKDATTKVVDTGPDESSDSKVAQTATNVTL